MHLDDSGSEDARSVPGEPAEKILVRGQGSAISASESEAAAVPLVPSVWSHGPLSTGADLSAWCHRRPEDWRRHVAVVELRGSDASASARGPMLDGTRGFKTRDLETEAPPAPSTTFLASNSYPNPAVAEAPLELSPSVDGGVPVS